MDSLLSFFWRRKKNLLHTHSSLTRSFIHLFRSIRIALCEVSLKCSNRTFRKVIFESRLNATRPIYSFVWVAFFFLCHRSRHCCYCYDYRLLSCRTFESLTLGRRTRKRERERQIRKERKCLKHANTVPITEYIHIFSVIERGKCLAITEK